MTKQRNDKEAEQRLQAHGEAFMRMFDDYESDQEPPASPSSSGDHAHHSPPTQPDHTTAPHNALDTLFTRPSTHKKQPKKPPHSNPPRSNSPLHTQPPPPVPSKSQFLSSKTSRVHAHTLSQPHSTHKHKQQQPSDDPTSRAAFLSMKREVATLGATGLDKRTRKVFEAQRLKAVGAAAEKSPRTPASIGLGMAKKQKQREVRAVEAAIETGMTTRKDVAKARRRQQERAGGEKRDRGLLEDGGGLRNGVLRVRKAPGGGKRKGGVPGKGMLKSLKL